MESALSPTSPPLPRAVYWERGRSLLLKALAFVPGGSMAAFFMWSSITYPYDPPMAILIPGVICFLGGLASLTAAGIYSFSERRPGAIEQAHQQLFDHTEVPQYTVHIHSGETLSFELKERYQGKERIVESHSVADPDDLIQAHDRRTELVCRAEELQSECRQQYQLGELTKQQQMERLHQQLIESA